MKTKKVRRCSSCKSTRHTKSQCQLHKTRRGSAPVVVRTIDKHTSSPHVLSLNKQLDKKNSLPSFSETAPLIRERRVVDFAQLVADHFEKESARHPESRHGEMKDPDRNAGILVPPLKLMATRGRLRPARDFAQDDVTSVERKKLLFSFDLKQKSLNLHPFIFISKQTNRLSDFVNGKIKNIQSFTKHFFLSLGKYTVLAIFLLALLPFPVIGYYRQVQQDSSIIVSHSTDAFLSLQSSTIAAMHTNIDQASTDLSLALASFASARQLVEEKHGMLMSLVKLLPIVGNEVQTRESILVAGHNIALGNAYLIKGINQAQQSEDLALTERITTFVYHVRSALPAYDEALLELAKVDVETLPVEYQETFLELRILFGAFINDMHDTVSLVDSLADVLGGDGLRTYLIVGQNSNELRPTGGFMGSMALVSVQRGKIVRFEVPQGGTYDVKGQLQTLVKPPLPLQTVNKRWELQDANWFFDFSASAQKVISFYEDARRETVDGVIAVNASVLERLLAVIGPVALNETSLEGDTVVSALEDTIAQKRSEKSSAPKAVLGDLVQELQIALLQSDSTDVVGLLLALSSSLSEKEIQLYFTDEELQKKVDSFGWAGTIQTVGKNQDYLSVNVSNIGGGKSDANVNQELEYDVAIQEDGRVFGMVTITRSYTTPIFDDNQDTPNITYIRTYVPQGSILVSASGFDFPSESMFAVPESWYGDDTDLLARESEVGFDEVSGTRITNEFGKTAFGNWVFLQPGEQKQVVLVYELPFRAFLESEINKKDTISSLFKISQNQTSGYSLVVQKQSGIYSPISVSIVYPNAWGPVWRSTDEIDLARNGALFTSDLKTDETIGIVLQKNSTN